MECQGGFAAGITATDVAKRSARSLRFTLELTPSTDRDFPEFSYAQLVQQTEDRRQSGPTTAPLPDEDSQDEQREVERIARGLEKKYGPRPMMGKRAIHEEDYVDVAWGYDETDPFVDNSEAHDDFLPHDFEPEFSRFYVNRGELLFKEAIESAETDSQASDGDFKTAKSGGSGKLFKLKPPKTRRTKDVKSEARKRKAQKGESTKNVKQAKSSEKNGETSQGTTMNRRSQETERLGGHVSHVSHVMEAGESAEAKVKPVPQLPADLPTDLKNMILTWKDAVAHESATTKPPKTLQTSHNQKLLDVGRRIMVLKPKKYHMIVYDYLASFLPATKETLQRRLKMMLKSEHDELIKEPLDKLKRAIDDVMIEQISQYVEKKKSIVSQDVTVVDDDNSDEEIESDKVKRVRPLKTFLWTETVRGLACDVVRAKVRALREINRKMVDPQSQLKTFLRDEVKTLWPQGWMNSRVLYLETKPVHESLTQIRPKKATTQTVVKRKEAVDGPLSQSTPTVLSPAQTVLAAPTSSLPRVQSVSSSQMPATPPQILSVISPASQLPSSSLQTTAVASLSSVLTHHSYSQPASAANRPLSLQIRNTSSVRPIQTITSSSPLAQLLSIMNQGHIRGQVQIIRPPAVPQIPSTTSGLHLPNTKKDKT